MSKLTTAEIMLDVFGVELEYHIAIKELHKKMEVAEARVLDLEQTLIEIERLVGGMAIIESKL